ncbi:EAL domain-containing protein [Ectothiorhodospiraceae bacterium WFHF3C12]|nr:EAL domain-containing protein [Ectothiorhodospiraceae bacterium WFHF3C12]
MNTPVSRRLTVARHGSVLYAVCGLIALSALGLFDLLPAAEMFDAGERLTLSYLLVLGTSPLVYRFLDRLVSEHERQQGRFRQLLEHSMDGLLLTAPDGRILEANASACRILGRSLDELRAVGRDGLFDRNDPELASMLERRSRDGSVRGTLWANRPDGERVRVEIASTVFAESSGEVRTAMVVRDVTEQWWARAQQSLAALALRHTADGLAVLDADWRVLYVNEGFERVTGRRMAEVIGHHPPLYEYLARDEVQFAAVLEEMRRKGYWAGEVDSSHASGQPLRLRGRLVAVSQQDSPEAAYVAVFSDVTPLTEIQQRLEALSDYCQLTGLPNRVSFERQVDERIAAMGHDRSPLVVMLVDPDHFRAINESLGLQRADAVLSEVAGRLSGIVEEDDLVARHTGDSFLILLGADHTASAAALTAQRILELFRVPIEVDGHSINVTVTIGASSFPSDGDTAETLLQAAETALANAKDNAREGFQFFAQGQDQWARRFVQVSSELRQALLHGEIVPYYQPIVDARTGALCSVEALARWRHPERGLLGPQEFIDVAERSEMISLLAEEILRQTCHDLVELERLGGPAITASVNISARQLAAPDLPEELEAIIQGAGLSTERVILELTESGMMRDTDAMPGLVSALKARGMSVVIDDFGTGYSSLAYLRFLPVDGLKIDRAFCRDLPEEGSSVALVRSVLTIAEQFGLTVVAEGVERPEQAMFLSRAGCQRLQGFLYGRPMPAESLLALALDSHRDIGTAVGRP